MKQQWLSRRVLLFVLGLSLLVNIVLGAVAIFDGIEHRQTGAKEEFSLISPQIAALEVDEFLAKQKLYQANSISLRNQVKEFIAMLPKGEVGYYYEDLKTGSWVGVNEKEQFTPGSLLKVPAVSAAARLVEEGQWTLQSVFEVTEVDVDFGYGSLAQKSSGYELSLYELMNLTITQSDNTANNVIRRNLPYGSFAQSMFGLGLPYATNIKNNIMNVTTKDMGSVMRSLYLSSYNKRSSSQLILSLMSQTDFDEGLVAGVPENVAVAHKIGVWMEGAQHHDCGIVYAKDKPYVLCIMTSGFTQAESDMVIGELSEKTYRYVMSSKQLDLD